MLDRIILLGTLLCVTACGARPAVPRPGPVTDTPAPPTASPSPSATTTQTPSPTATPTTRPSATPSTTPVPTVESLRARVTADLLSCRYGPGPEYLYLYALRKEANIRLVGRTDSENWTWVYVDGRNKCWVNAKFLTVEGDWLSLPIVYPGVARIPRSPYYNPTEWVGATRAGDTVDVSWSPIRLRAGDEEDESMLIYIIEIWRCEGGRLLFEPYATNEPYLTILDEPGCNQPSHGRVYFQEKHGYAGPSEIPWPPHVPPG